MGIEPTWGLVRPGRGVPRGVDGGGAAAGTVLLRAAEGVVGLVILIRWNKRPLNTLPVRGRAGWRPRRAEAARQPQMRERRGYRPGRGEGGLLEGRPPPATRRPLGVVFFRHAP